MPLRTTIVGIMSAALLALPAAATASTVPDPPPQPGTDTIQAAIDLLTEAYAQAPLSAKRGIHNEIVLLINVGHAAL